MELDSPVFGNGGFIPVLYSCRGRDVPLPLNIDGVPEWVKSLA